MKQQQKLMLLPLVLLLLVLLAPPARAAPAADASPPPPRNQKACCAALPFPPSAEVPAIILTLTEPLPERRGVEVVGRLCECGIGGGPAISASAAADDNNAQQPWIELRIRGSTSARDFAKKSFSFNFVSDPAADKQAPKPEGPPLLGLPAADGRWAVLAVADDRTLGTRSSLAFSAYRQATGRWAPRTALFELFVRVEGAGAAPAAAPLDYRGVYLLSERVSRHPLRVDVARYRPPPSLRPPGATQQTDDKDDPDAGTGGFLLAYENDNVRPGEPVFATRMTRLAILVEDPSERVLANASAAAVARPRPQDDPLAYLARFFDEMERALMAPGPLVELLEEDQEDNIPPTTTTNNNATLVSAPPLRPFFDAAAATDYFLLTELTKNPDGYRGSVKMSKDKAGPVVMGPPWDYGEAFGTCCGFPVEGFRQGGRSGPGTSGGSAISPEGWRFNICADQGRCRVEPADGTSQWFRRLWQDGGFRAGVARRWRAMRSVGGVLGDAFFERAIGGPHDALTRSGAAARNYERWASELPPRPEEMRVLELSQLGGAVLAAPTMPPTTLTPTTTPPPPAQFVAANLALRQWTAARVAWMDRALEAVSDPLAAPDAYLRM